MVRTYQQVTSMDFGFRPDHVLTMMLTLPESKYPGGAELANFSRELLSRVRSLPGVTDVCVASNRPAGAGLAFRNFSIPQAETTQRGTWRRYRLERAPRVSFIR